MSNKEKDKSQEAIDWKKEIIEMIIYAGTVLILVWLILTFIGQRIVVDGISMNDTLNDRDSLWLNKLVYRLHDPERFDIVVFPGDEEHKFVIKRVIGLPGETVQIDQNGDILINGSVLDEHYGKEVIDEYSIGLAWDEIKLGSDEYFVLGDNRNESLDSRYEEIGNVSIDEIMGKASFRIWPLSNLGKVE